MQSETQPSPTRILRIALAAQCHPDTVRRYLRGQNTRPSITERIENAVKAEKENKS